MSNEDQLADDGRYDSGKETVADTIKAAMAELRGDDAPEDAAPVEDELEAVEPVEADADDGSEDAPQVDEDGEDAEPAALKPPASWSAEDGAEFDKLPREVQEVVLRREGEREAHFTRQSQELAPLRNLAQQYNQYYQSIGADTVTAAQNLFAADRVLRSGTPEQKRAMFGELTKVYGLEAVLGQQAPSEDEDVFADPAVSALKAEIEQLKGSLTSRQAAEQQLEAQRLQTEVADFFNATTEAGEPAHPYIEQVVDDMSALIQVRQAQGINPTANDLQTFYEQACWANPDVRAKLQADEQRQARAREQASERQRVEKAKAASSSISGVSGAVAARNGKDVPKDESVRDTILRSIAEVNQASL